MKRNLSFGEDSFEQTYLWRDFSISFDLKLSTLGGNKDGDFLGLKPYER